MCAARRFSTRPLPSPMVAVVDDDPGVRRALSRMLRADGLRVASFASAEELLHAYGELRPNCLVVDVVLPGMSGPDLLDRLRARKEQLPAIFVTGRIDTEQGLKLRGFGEIPCLQKPFEPALLIDAVMHALGRVSAVHP